MASCSDLPLHLIYKKWQPFVKNKKFESHLHWHQCMKEGRSTATHCREQHVQLVRSEQGITMSHTQSCENTRMGTSGAAAQLAVCFSLVDGMLQGRKLAVAVGSGKWGGRSGKWGMPGTARRGEMGGPCKWTKFNDGPSHTWCIMHYELIQCGWGLYLKLHMKFRMFLRHLFPIHTQQWNCA